MTVVAAVVVVVLSGVGLVTAAMFAPGGWTSNSAAVLVAVGLISTTVTSLLALSKVEKVHHDIHNGVVVEKTVEAIHTAVADGTLPAGPAGPPQAVSGHPGGPA